VSLYLLARLAFLSHRRLGTRLTQPSNTSTVIGLAEIYTHTHTHKSKLFQQIQKILSHKQKKKKKKKNKKRKKKAVTPNVLNPNNETCE
jgi:hypothetical protein